MRRCSQNIGDTLGSIHRQHFLGRTFGHCAWKIGSVLRVPEPSTANGQPATPGFKYLVTEMVCWATGGPQKYTGRSMYESHKDMKITGPEWDAFMDDFQQTLDKFSVPAQEQAELKAIVDSTRADIVVKAEAVATS